MTADEHQKRFENTEALLKEDSMNVNFSQHFDWLAVIMFYGAVHLVENS